MKSFDEVLERVRTIEIPETFDLVVAIANGGIIPAAMINQRLGCEYQLLKLNLRDAMQNKLYDKPKLLAEIDFDFKGKKILLVDDRVKTGTTLQFAKQLLSDAKTVKTLAVNGIADYCLYNEPCFRFPWIV
ncbi:MAG: phosphoribosyltransferase [Bacteroidota bacterium]|nr:phosphoribosyltransferase [Bacteroidota bacterium]